MTSQPAAQTTAVDDTLDTPQLWALIIAYSEQQTREGGAAAARDILAHLEDIRKADKHALWCAEVNLDGAKEHLAEVQRDLATARQDALEEAAEAVEAHSLAEKLARLTMSNPVGHALNLVRVISTAVRALKDKPAPYRMTPQPATVPVLDTPIARAIEADATSFETSIGHKPLRIAAPASYEWGWRYQDDAVQQQFKAWCNRDKTKTDSAPTGAA